MEKAGGARNNRRSRSRGMGLRSIFLGFLGIVMLSAFGDHNVGTRFVEGHWGMAAKLAQDAHKPILVFIGAPYCKFSESMEDVFNAPEVGMFYNKRFVCKRLDTSNPMSNIRASNWGVTSVPTFLFMDSRRKVVHKVCGYRSPNQIIEEGQFAIRKIEEDRRQRKFGF